MSRLLIAAALFAAFACSAGADDLDKPLNDKPTPRTEIKRGYMLAFHCAIDSPGDGAGPIGDCISSAAREDEQRHPDYEPFELGLFYGEATHIWLLLGSDQHLADTENNFVAADHLEDERREFYFAYNLFRLKQKKLGITDQQLVDSSGITMPEGKATALRELRAWEASPPAKPDGLD